MQVIECHNRTVSRFDSRGAKWCMFCMHFAILDVDKTCECCHSPISAKEGLKVFEAMDISRFHKILQSNRSCIEAFEKNPSLPELQYGWAVKLGIINYYVPVRYLAEYKGLTYQNDLDKYRKFLESVKSRCEVLPRHIHSVK